MEPFALAGPAGRIEGRLELPDTSAMATPRFLAVFGHPHPQHGGTMQNRVVVQGARALAGQGGAVARFNFRGVGRSEGGYDEGRGELDDYLAVVAHLRARWPQVPGMIAAGFSFGSIRALECAACGAGTAWLGVAPPLALAKYAAHVPERLDVPAAMVLAGADELVAAPTPDELARRFAELRAVATIAGAGHLFSGRVAEVGAAVARLLPELLR